MKKTQWIELIRSIKGTWISFLSIVMFVALGIAIFSGMTWTGTHFENGVNNWYAKNNFQDIQISYPFGLSDDQVSQIKNLEGIADAEGYNIVYPYYFKNGEHISAAVIQITERLNQSICMEGEMPQKDGEVAVLAHWAEANGISVGDTVTFVPGNDDTLRLLRAVTEFSEKGEGKIPTGNALTTDCFTVTALIDSPTYTNTNPVTFGVVPGSGFDLKAIFFVSEDSFNKEIISGFNTVAVKGTALAGFSSYSDEYMQEAKQIVEQITTLTNQWNASVIEQFHTASENAKEKLDEADEKIRKAKEEIAEQEKALADGHSKYEQGKIDYANGEKELSDAKELYEENLQKYEKGKKSYEENLAAFKEAQKDLDCISDFIQSAKSFLKAIHDKSGQADELSFIETAMQTGLVDAATQAFERFKERKDLLSPILEDQIGISLEDIKDLNFDILFNLPTDYESIRQIMSEAIQNLISYYQQAETSINESRSKLEQAKKELADAEIKLSEAEEQIRDGELKLESSRKELEEAEKALTDGEQKLADGKAELEQGIVDFEEASKRYEQVSEHEGSVDAVKSLVSNRRSNPAFTTTWQILSILKNFRYSLALVFFVVSLLVCYSSVSRMVGNSLKQIGTQKALGFYHHEILLHFLLYVIIAVTIGGLLSALLGIFPVENLFITALYKNFTMEKANLFFSLLPVLVPFIIELLLIALVAFFACRKALKRKTVELLTGGVKVEGKHRFYEKLKIWNRLPLLSKTIINNLFTDKKRVFGMLIGITGCSTLLVMGLTFYINYSDSLQRQFDTYFLFDGYVSFQTDAPEVSANIKNVLEKHQIPNAEVIHSRVFLTYPDGNVSIPYVTVPVNPEEFSKLTYFQTDPASVHSFDQGFWAGNSFKYAFDENTVELTTFTGAKAKLDISRYFNYHLMTSHVFMDAQTYREHFDENAVPNAYYIRTEGADLDALLNDLRAVNGYRFYHDYKTGASMAFQSVGSVTQVIVITYVFLAIAMAFMVLLNLLAVYVDEKKRELIILVINGYPKKFARRYIYQDTIVLMIVGILIGTVIGSALGINALQSMEGEVFRLIHSVNWLACLIGALITATVTFIITAFTMRRVNRLRLTDINS